MSNKPAENTNPMCCGERSTWINYSKYLQYFYCKKCKQEVNDCSKNREDDGLWGIRRAPYTRPTVIMSSGSRPAGPQATSVDPYRETVDFSRGGLCGPGIVKYIHYWDSQAIFDLYIPCQCGLRYKN